MEMTNETWFFDVLGCFDVLRVITSCQNGTHYHSFNCTTLWAGRHGHLSILKSRRDSILPTHFMDEVASLGHLHIVKWLHETSEGCTTYAMNFAATNGHLHIVQWLHENRDEGCTTVAMTNAIRNGHLHVIQWLYTNRQERSSYDPMVLAASHGHLHIIQWLLRIVRCTLAVMRVAVRNDHYHVAGWLFGHRRAVFLPNEWHEVHCLWSEMCLSYKHAARPA
jgi:hypothetical protein